MRISGLLLATTALSSFWSIGAHAQDTPPADPPVAADEAQDDIVVTGFRASLESAVAEKKNRDLIVESISAEDIGKLPDASIAESIARLPGLTSQRVSGRSNSISIRGFAPDFSTTLLNGREQTSTGDNRAVEYDQYPSEVVSSVLVYKTANAALIGQGLSGTVDLRTIRPLDFGREVIQVGARGTYADIGKLNAGSREYGYRVSGTYVDQFANDTIGVALSAAYLDEPYQVQEFNAWGYAGAGTEASPFVIGGSKSYVTSTQLKRLGLSGTLQWRPAPEFTSTFDAFYSDFSDDQIKRGIELPLGFDVNNDPAAPNATKLTNLTVENGVATAGRFSNVEGVVRNDAFERDAKLYAFGYNGRYQGDDGWNAQVDISYSRTDRTELVLESYAGTGYGADVGATDTIDFQTTGNGTTFNPTLNYSDPSLIVLTDPLGWGGANLQAGYSNARDVEDEIQQYRVEVEREIDGPFSALRVGGNYTRHVKSLQPDESRVILAGGATQTPIPSQYLQGSTDLAYLGLGPMVSYDPRDLIAGGVLVLVSNNSNPDVVAKAFRVEEDLMTAYAQADLSAELGTAELTGNIGIQAVFTEQKSSGLVFNGTSFNPITRGDDYVDVLPSVNLALRLASDIVIRAGAARQMQRPRMDDMRVALGYGYNDLEQVYLGGGGNPDLRPIRSNSFDLTVEKYFGTRGYLAVQGFYKDLKSFVYNLEVPYDFTGFPPSAGDPAPGLGRATIPINGEGGHIYGVELAGTLPIGEIVSTLDGFGLTGGASYTKTGISPTPGAPAEDIPGYSRWVANGTAYFEKWGVNLRSSVRYRSSFVGELSGFGAGRVRRRAREELIVDGQIGYDFAQAGALNGLSVYLQGQNLTDEPFVTIDPASGQVIDHQVYGRRFLAGFNFKF